MDITLIDVKKLIEELSEEELKYFFTFSSLPKGWISVEDHLPQWLAEDVKQGYSVYKVKNSNGEEFETTVADHTYWYYIIAIPQKITHWYND